MPRHTTVLAVVLAIVGTGVGFAPAQPPASKPTPTPTKAPPAKTPTNPDEHSKPPVGQEVDLRPKFTLGKLTRYEMTMTSGNKIKSDQEDLNQDQTMMQSIGLSMKVKSVDDDGATVELVYDRIKASLETGDTKATFDSTTPKAKPANTSPASTPSKPAKNTPANPKAKPGTKNPSNTPAPASKPSAGAGDADMSELLSQIMGPMVGTTLTMKVDKDGNIKSVSGGDALTGAGAAGGLLGGAGGAGGLGGLGGGGTGLPMPQAGASASNPMSWIVNSPGQKGVVHVGETWTNTDSLGGTPVGGFKMITKHTCRSGGPVANLVFSGRADQASEGQGESPTGFTLKDTTYNGDYSWDTVRGELSNMNSTMKAMIDGKIAGISMSMSSNTKVSVKRLN